MKDSTRKWSFTLIMGLVLWSFLFLMRAQWYKPWCAATPTPCMADQVNWLDRIVFQFGSVQADFWSNVVQNSVGIAVFLIPWFILPKTKAIKETLITGSIAFWNLAFLEVVRALVQRPRPLVFSNVMGDGTNINQYTSFYSGHTSFVALATVSFVFMITRHRQELSKTSRISLWVGAAFFTALTGILRVLGGRHYPTDVIAGLLAGFVIASFFQRKDY